MELELFPSLDFEKDTRKTPRKAKSIPVIFMNESGSLYNPIMNSMDNPMLILPAIEVNATPFF
jgi:hypothetical protein